MSVPGPPPVRNWADPAVTEIGGTLASLTDQDGTHVTEKNYEKYYKLVYFGFCRTVLRMPDGAGKTR